MKSTVKIRIFGASLYVPIVGTYNMELTPAVNLNIVI